ncbi:acyltransferase family protein [Roseateles oligotrophus]|uniref:Acyltransferase n=1 Tax=Roseateles oligotrophus TaxID=1769250 RepID=A0ABT2YK87_9BURK|nr:acyltransferase [Roseateles oligotrophus]MCV2370381.1 acyltransferase [Roseateles oligotrophus]
MDKHLHPQAPAPKTQRLFFLDWLRILAFGLLVFYHVGMYYVSWGWHVKSATLVTALEPLMMLSSPWRMALLFFISGAATQALMRKTQGAGLLKQRSARLLWPLLFGMFIIVPPQSYFEVVYKLGFEGSYPDFMQRYLAADPNFCRIEAGARRCLTVPTWNHLWFLPYLWIYTVLAWALVKTSGPQLDRLSALIARSGPATLMLGLALPLMFSRLTLVQFEGTNNLVWDWYNHAQYLSVFLLGLLCMRGTAVDDSLWANIARLRWPALLLALTAWGLLQGYFSHYAETPPPFLLRMATRLLWGGMQWWAIMAACGFAKQWLNFDGAWRRRLSSSVFCVYILHQTVIILLTQALRPLGLAPGIEAPLLIALTLAICLLSYAGLRRLPFSLVIMGITERPDAAPHRSEDSARSIPS